MPVTEVGDIIIINLAQDESRVCDYCDAICTTGTREQPNIQITRRRCHSTDYGLICDECMTNLDKTSKEAGETPIRRYRTFELDEVYPTAPIRGSSDA